MIRTTEGSTEAPASRGVFVERAFTLFSFVDSTLATFHYIFMDRLFIPAARRQKLLPRGIIAGRGQYKRVEAARRNKKGRTLVQINHS